MELPNLLNNFRKEPPKKRYLGVEIGLESVRTVVWEIIGETPSIVQVGSLEQVDTSDPQKLLNAIDVSLAQALAGINPEPNQMILSLPDSWLSQTEITVEKKQLLRFISQKMALKPVGFVITIEAIIHYLETKRGHPPTAIVLGLNTEDVAVSIVQNGRILATHTVGRSDDIGADVEEGIARFGQIKTLPSNIVIYDGLTDLEQLQQDLIEYDWQSRLPFLHIPKIDRLSNDEVVEAVVLTAGSEYIKAQQDSNSSDDVEHSDETEVEAALPSEETIPDKQVEFGFTVSHPEHKSTVLTTDQDSESDSEYVEADANITPAEIPAVNSDFSDDEDTDEDEEYASLPAASATPSQNPWKKLLTFGRNGRKKIPPVNRSRRLVLLLIVLILVLFGSISAAIAGYWYLPKAQVILYVKPQTINRQVTFRVDPTITEIDIEGNRIPGVPVETEITASAETPATGEKLVGERATGSVTLYNRTDSVKSFAAGTRLTSDSGLAYTLDEDVSIASASSKENPDLSITTEPATVAVDITAVAIGAEYNISDEAEFSVANFDKSSFVARLTGELSGGTSRQITAVAQADIDQLIADVNQEIEEKVLAQVQQSQQGFTGAVILANETESAEDEFSAQIGDEADVVRLESRLMVRSITYKKSDLSTIIQNKALDEIPENFQLNPDDISLEIQSTEEAEDGTVRVTASSKILVSPNINPVTIASDVRGKFPAVTEDYFKSQPGFERVEIDIRPSFPASIKTFPRIEENITVEIELVK